MPGARLTHRGGAASGLLFQSLSLLSLLLLLLPLQSAVSVPRDFEGCSTLRKYLGQLHFLQSRIPMGQGQDAAVPVTW